MTLDVLIVESNANPVAVALRTQLERCFQKAQVIEEMKVLLPSSEESALAKLREGYRPQVVIVDMEFVGLPWLEQAKQFLSMASVYLLTAADTPELKQQVKNLGFPYRPLKKAADELSLIPYAILVGRNC